MQNKKEPLTNLLAIRKLISSTGCVYISPLPPPSLPHLCSKIQIFLNSEVVLSVPLKKKKSPANPKSFNWFHWPESKPGCCTVIYCLVLLRWQQSNSTGSLERILMFISCSSTWGKAGTNKAESCLSTCREGKGSMIPSISGIYCSFSRMRGTSSFVYKSKIGENSKS